MGKSQIQNCSEWPAWKRFNGSIGPFFPCSKSQLPGPPSAGPSLACGMMAHQGIRNINGKRSGNREGFGSTNWQQNGIEWELNNQ